MMPHGKPGTCPFCFAKVWRDKGEIMRPVLEFEPMAPSEVIPALKARQSLYYRKVIYHSVFVWVDPLSLARKLKAGGAPPDNIHALHRHQDFTPDEPRVQPLLPLDPPF